MAITDIDDLTRPLSDLVGEQGEKAAKRKKQLAEVRATRAAGMTADEAKAAAERGDFPGVEPSRVRGPLDLDEDIDQDTGPSFFDYAGAYFTDPRLSFIGAGVDLLGRTGAATAPYTENFLKTISQGGDSFIAKAGQFLFEDAANVAAKINAGTSFDELTPFEKLAIASVPAEVIPGLGLAPDILKLGRNFVINLGDDAAKLLDNYMVSKQAVTDTGIMMSIDDKPARVRGPSDFEGIFGGKGINILGGAPIDLTDEKIIKILENSRKGVYKSDLQAALEIQKLNPGSGLVVTNDKVAGGFQTTDKFRKLLKDYKSGKDDIFEADIAVGGSNIGRNVKNKILQAKEIADADISDVSYAIKFRKALSNFFKPKFAEDVFDDTDGVFYPPTNDGTLKKAKAILEYLGEDPKLLNLAKTGTEGSGLDLWNKIKINSDEPIKGEALNYFKKQIIFDDTGKAFQQVKSDLVKKNKFVSSKLSQAKNLFENKSVNFFDVDHIQAPRFGGTNAETNLQLLPVGEHKLLKQLTPDKTIASKAVKSKTNFEIEFFNKSTEVVNLIKKGDTEKAMKLSSELDNLVNDFKNTFKNINFKVAEPHVPIKTGDKTGKYIKYSDKLKLSSEQKELVNTLLNKDEYSNLSNVGKTIEQQANEILNMYEQVALISPTGKIPSKSLKIPGDITSMDVPLPAGEVNLRKDFSGMRDGGIIDIFKMTRPINAER